MQKIQHLGEVFFSQLSGKPIYDHTGKKIGRLHDMVVRWDGCVPCITGIRYSRDINKLIPAHYVEEWGRDNIQLNQAWAQTTITTLNEEELYVGKWLLDKQIIDMKGSRLVRVNDILLSCIKQAGRHFLMLNAADIGVRGLLRRLGCEFVAQRFNNHFISWQFIAPLATRTASLQLKHEKDQLSELHPADIADIAEQMDYQSRTSFFAALDAQQAVDALTEMDLDTQVEIITQLDRDRASDILEELPPDEAADILSEMPEEASHELLMLMETEEAEEVKELMLYPEDTAGGLMTTAYIGLQASFTVEETIVRLRELAPDAETIYYLYVVDEQEKLLGVLSLRELIIALPEVQLHKLMHTKVIAISHAESHRRVAETIRKYGLLAVPVVDEQNTLLGIVTVDDVLDILMPERPVADVMSLNLIKRTMRRG